MARRWARTLDPAAAIGHRPDHAKSPSGAPLAHRMKPAPALLARQFAEQDQVTHERTASAGPWPGDSRTSSVVIIPRVSVPLLAALVLDCGSDVPYAYLERQRVLLVHAAQLVHERGHVPHGVVRKALHAHELPAAGLREAGDHTCLDSVEVSHALLRLLPSGTVSATCWYTRGCGNRRPRWRSGERKRLAPRRRGR